MWRVELLLLRLPLQQSAGALTAEDRRAGAMGSKDRDERRSVWEDIMQRAGLAGPSARPFDGHAP